jgi:hypothetical protein
MCILARIRGNLNNDNLDRREKVFKASSPGSRKRTEIVSRRDIKQQQG